MASGKSKRVGIYARVSTGDQTPQNQLLDLRRFASERGWTVQGEYVDEGVSGTKESRPALDRLMDAARKRRIDVVLVWRFDRFARSVKHLVLALDELRALGIDFISYQENVDTTTPLGQALFTIIAAIAALERELIVERVRAGLRRARSQGKRLGRPPVDVDPQQVLECHRRGLSLRAIGRALGTSRTKIASVLKSLASDGVLKTASTGTP